jgi:transposase
MEEHLKRKRRQYDRQFKIDAVKYWASSGKSGKAVCEELGIPNRDFLSRWKKELRNKGGASAFPGQGKKIGPDADLARLRKELRDVAEERDILKKALAILSRY